MEDMVYETAHQPNLDIKAEVSTGEENSHVVAGLSNSRSPYFLCVAVLVGERAEVVEKRRLDDCLRQSLFLCLRTKTFYTSRVIFLMHTETLF